jgi:hypothetical protein
MIIWVPSAHAESSPICCRTRQRMLHATSCTIPSIGGSRLLSIKNLDSIVEIVSELSETDPPPCMALSLEEDVGLRG